MNNNISPKNLITEETVRYVAALSRISMDGGDVSRFSRQLADILGYIGQLNEVDTENTSPTTHVLPTMKNVFRKDELKASLTQDEALSNAPERHDGFFKVPKVI